MTEIIPVIQISIIATILIFIVAILVRRYLNLRTQVDEIIKEKVMNPGFGKYTEKVIKDVIECMEGVELDEINIQTDHVHMVMIIPPKYSIASVVRRLKSESAKKVRKKFEWMDKVYWGTRSLRGKGYFVSTIGLNEEQIRRYVRYQQNQDSGQTKFEI